MKKNRIEEKIAQPKNAFDKSCEMVIIVMMMN